MSTKHPIFVPIETSAFSGATLLGFLLGSHPCIATVGEMDGIITSRSIDEYLCSCGRKIKECEFWQSIETAMANKGFEFDVSCFDTKFVLNGPNFIQRLRVGAVGNGAIDSIRDKILFALPTETRQLKALVARNVALIEAVLETTNKTVFLDTSKDRLRIKALRKFSSLDVRALHLVRDVRGVVASQLRRGKKNDVDTIAKKWVRQHRTFETTLKNWSEKKYIRVRYEDLCQDTEGTLKQICDFCGVDSNFNFENFRTAPHHILGNKMRLRSTSEIELDERWKIDLTAEQLKTIDQVAGTLMRQYGYN